MKKQRYARGAWFFLAAGMALALAGLIGLYTFSPLLEYVIVAPQVTSAQPAADSGGEDTDGAAADADAQKAYDTGLETLLDARKKLTDQLEGGVTTVAIGGARSGASVSTGGDLSQTVTLQAVDVGWFEACPRYLSAGRLLTETELKSGAKRMVLDEDLAFQLFRSAEAVGSEVILESISYTVVGVVRHSRGVGEVDSFSAYIPLRAASAQGLQLDSVTMYAVPVPGASADQTFETAMREAWGEKGSFYSLNKEIMRRTMLPRLMLFVFAMALLLRATGLLKRLRLRVQADIHERMRHSYFRGWFGPALLRIAGLAALYALALAAVCAALAFVIQPVYTFTEWVPESLVEVSAIRTVFWNLAAKNAAVVNLHTSEYSAITLYGALLRWGCILLLMGGCLLNRRKKNTKSSEEILKMGTSGMENVSKF